MTEDVERNGSERFAFLEGIRGLSCVQIMIIHYLSSFLPPLARMAGYPHYDWEIPLARSPFFALINATVTVFLFFLVSTFVLAQSYLKIGRPLRRQPLKRFLRLFLPTATSVLIAIVLILAWPQPRAWVAPAAHSIWAERLYAHPMTFLSLCKDLLLNSMLVGYRGASLFDLVDSRGVLVAPLNLSMNPPLWTLHAEFWGSMLVLLLACLYRNLPRPWFWLVFAALFFVTGTSHFTLFLIGFAGYLAHRPILSWRGWKATATGILLVGIGAYISGRADPFPFDRVLEAAPRFTWLQASAGFRLQSEVAGLFIMSGLMVLPRIRQMLSAPWILWLGRGSFGLYLVHFPLLFTVGYAVFAWALPHMAYGAAIAVSLLAGGTLSLAVAKLFEHWIDRPSLRLSNRVLGRRKPCAGGEPAPSADGPQDTSAPANAWNA